MDFTMDNTTASLGAANTRSFTIPPPPSIPDAYAGPQRWRHRVDKVLASEVHELLEKREKEGWELVSMSDGDFYLTVAWKAPFAPISTTTTTTGNPTATTTGNLAPYGWCANCHAPLPPPSGPAHWCTWRL